MGESFSTEKMVSFHQILKKGQNIKIDIWKCPIKVELVKKSSYRAGTLQMPFEIHSNLCAIKANLTKLVGFVCRINNQV